MDQKSVTITCEGFIIRPFEHNPADLAAVLEVYRQCEDFLALGPVPTASLEMVLSDLKLSADMGGCFCLICLAESGAVVGVFDYVASGYEGRPDVADLSLLMIAQSQRGKGLGEAAVRAVENEILRTGKIRLIESGVQVNNPVAIRFWRRMGYQIDSGATPMPDGTTVYHLSKAV